MSPTRTELEVPASVTWLTSVVVAPAPIAVEPVKVAFAPAPSAVAPAAVALDNCPHGSRIGRIGQCIVAERGGIDSRCLRKITERRRIGAGAVGLIADGDGLAAGRIRPPAESLAPARSRPPHRRWLSNGTRPRWPCRRTQRNPRSSPQLDCRRRQTASRRRWRRCRWRWSFRRRRRRRTGRRAFQPEPSQYRRPRSPRRQRQN